MAIKILKAVVVATLLAGSGVQAQNLAQIGGPANAPPAGFRGQQFVDSRGCLFLRAGYGDGVNWVARVDRNHKPICTMTPTGSAAAQAAVAADMGPDPQAVPQGQAAQTQPVQTQTAAPQVQTAVAAQAPIVQTPGKGPSHKVYAAASAGDTTVPRITMPVVTMQPAQVSTRSHVLPKPPKGWVYAWKDDRLNPLRGVGTSEGQAQQDQVWQRTVPMVLVTEAAPQALALTTHATAKPQPLHTAVSTMSAVPDQPQAGATLLIQVGCFGEPGNAQGAAARLSGLGLPVSTSTVTRKGKVLQVVYAGPFPSHDAASAGLATLHGAGFSDAFLR